MVAVEFDGAAYHGSKEQRERDVRRDAELATLGILVVRLTHKRLHANPETVVTELVSILAARRRQLRAS
jgi:very-short-patch-repair endonuclease